MPFDLGHEHKILNPLPANWHSDVSAMLGGSCWVFYRIWSFLTQNKVISSYLISREMEMTYFRKDGSAFFYLIFVNYEAIYTSLNALCNCRMRHPTCSVGLSSLPRLSPSQTGNISNTTEKSRGGGLHKLRKKE